MNDNAKFVGDIADSDGSDAESCIPLTAKEVSIYINSLGIASFDYIRRAIGDLSELRRGIERGDIDVMAARDRFDEIVDFVDSNKKSLIGRNKALANQYDKGDKVVVDFGRGRYERGKVISVQKDVNGMREVWVELLSGRRTKKAPSYVRKQDSNDQSTPEDKGREKVRKYFEELESRWDEIADRCFILKECEDFVGDLAESLREDFPDADNLEGLIRERARGAFLEGKKQKRQVLRKRIDVEKLGTSFTRESADAVTAKNLFLLMKEILRDAKSHIWSKLKRGVRK